MTVAANRTLLIGRLVCPVTVAKTSPMKVALGSDMAGELPEAIEPSVGREVAQYVARGEAHASGTMPTCSA